MINHYLLSFLIVSSIYLLQSTNAGCFLSTEYSVYVTNNLPPWTRPLKLHCAAKDDDHGTISLSEGQQFTFKFCDYGWSTLYFCRFWWNGKDSAFVVYDSSWEEPRCIDNGVCYYDVKEEGFYFSNSNPPQNESLLVKW